MPDLEAKIAALKSLQESVQKSGKLQPWLEKHELAGLPRAVDGGPPSGARPHGREWQDLGDLRVLQREL